MSLKETLLTDPDLKNIYVKMLEYLARGDMAEKRLVDRIVRLRLRYPKSKRYVRYTADNAWKIIPLLRDAGYVDEKRYAQRVFDALRDKKDGLRVIRRKMLQRQIQAAIVDEIIKKFSDSGEQDLSRIIQQARIKLKKLRQRYAQAPKSKYEIKQKLYAWLAMKGYSSEETSKIIREAFVENAS